MLSSHKLTIKNNQEYIKPDDMFKILYVEYLTSVRELKERGKSIFQRPNKLQYRVHEDGRELYEIFVAIFLSRKIFDFLYWKPYVKTINLYKLTQTLMTELRLSWSMYYRGHNIPFRTNDHKINILWHLHERGMTFESILLIPRYLRKMTRAFLYTDYYLEKIFESDYREDRMIIFSNNPEETWYRPHYYDSYGRYRYRNPSYAHIEVQFDTHEFNQQAIDNTPTMVSGTSNVDDSGDYRLYINTVDTATAEIQRIVYSTGNGTDSTTTANTGTVWSMS